MEFLYDDFNILKLNFTHIKYLLLLQKLPLFYKDIITCFNKSKACSFPLAKSDLIQQIIWGNRHITHWSKSHQTQCYVYYKNWVQAGITHVQDNGKIDYEYIYTKISFMKLVSSIKQ